MMDSQKYVRVRQPANHDGTAPAAENEVRVTALGKTRSVVSQTLENFNEKNMDTVILSALGKTIHKCVAIAEIVKRRVPDLHQKVDIATVKVIDVWEPKEGIEGIEKVEKERMTSVITITLSKGGVGLDTEAPGYQKPVPEEEVVEENEHLLAIAGEEDQVGGGKKTKKKGFRGGGGRGRGRGRRGQHQAAGEGQQEG